jgi:hypothetical protein
MEEFEALLQQLAALNHERRLLHARDESGLPSHPLNVVYREALEADWRAANPKRVWRGVEKALSADQIPNHAAIMREHSAAAKKWLERTISTPLRETEKRLFELAADLPVPARRMAADRRAVG